jgi:hypothetical protein
MKRQLVNVAVEKSHEALSPIVAQTNTVKDTGNRTSHLLANIDFKLEDALGDIVACGPGEGDGLPSLLGRVREVHVGVLAEGVEGVEKSGVDGKHSNCECG